MRNLFFIIIIIILLFSCKNNNFKFDLPQTETPSEFNQWGVTIYDQLKLRNSPNEESETVKYLPLGAIIEILKKDKELKNFENANDYWYYINYKGEEGWIFGIYIQIFNTYDESEKKSEIIIFGNKTNEPAKKQQ
jgi:hypothetical protein